MKSAVLSTVTPITIAGKKSWVPAKILATSAPADPAMAPALNSLMHLLEGPAAEVGLSLLLSDITRPASNVRTYAAELAPATQLKKLEAAVAQFVKALPENTGKDAPKLDAQYAALKHAIRAFETAITIKVEDSGSLDVTSRARLTRVARELDVLEGNAASLARKVVSGDPAGTALAKLATLSNDDLATLKIQLSNQALSLRAPLSGAGLGAEAKRLSALVRSFSGASSNEQRSSSFDALVGQMAKVEHLLIVQLRRFQLIDGKSFASSVAVQLGVMHDAAASIAGRIAEVRPGSVLLEQLAARGS